ncbi:MAG: lactococcin 972 family bacteriocin [Culicoidibacterales bacterium]
MNKIILSFSIYFLILTTIPLNSYAQIEFAETTPYTVTSGNVDGGYWIRGKRENSVISEYKHYSKQGKASVVNGMGYTSEGDWKSANIYSKASQSWSFLGTNKSYYDWR